MAIETRINGETYERLALAEPDRKWELRDGILREKPGMTAAHNWLEVELGFMLMSQLDRSTYQVRIDSGRVRRPGATYFIPDVFVVPTAYVIPLLDQHDVLEVYDKPLPLVVEVPLDRCIRCRGEAGCLPAARRPGDLAHPSLRSDVDGLASPFRRQLRDDGLPRGQCSSHGAARRRDRPGGVV